MVNHRLEEEEKEKAHSLSEVVLYKKDIFNLVSLLDKEIHGMDPSHKIMRKDQLKTFCNVLVDRIENKDSLQDQVDLHFASSLKHKLPRVLRKISEFFLKVASIFDNNIITKGVEKIKSFKEELTNNREKGGPEQLDSSSVMQNSMPS